MLIPLLVSGRNFYPHLLVGIQFKVISHCRERKEAKKKKSVIIIPSLFFNVERWSEESPRGPEDPEGSFCKDGIYIQPGALRALKFCLCNSINNPFHPSCSDLSFCFTRNLVRTISWTQWFLGYFLCGIIEQHLVTKARDGFRYWFSLKLVYQMGDRVSFPSHLRAQSPFSPLTIMSLKLSTWRYPYIIPI